MVLWSVRTQGEGNYNVQVTFVRTQGEGNYNVQVTFD